MLVNLVSNAVKFTKAGEVDAALDRLRRGTYGVCEESGKVIPDERLRAVPWTRYTREVAERHERQAR